MPSTTSFPPGPPPGPPPPPYDPPPPPPSPPPSPPPYPAGRTPRLERDPGDAVLAGVCAAVARHTDTDPVLWRVALAVLALFGGAGVVLYAVGWLLIPRRGQQRAALERSLRRPDGSLGPGGIVVVVVAGVLLLAALADGPGAGVLLVLGVLVYLAVRDRRGPARGAAAGAYETRPYQPVPTPAGAPGATGDPSDGTPPAAAPEVPRYVAFGDAPRPEAPPAWQAASWPSPSGEPLPPEPPPAPWPPPVPRQRRPPSRLGPLTVSAATLLVGLLLALRLSGVDAVTAPRTVAAALLVVGAGLLVGTWVGRARWLLAVGLLLALLLAATAAADRAGIDDGLGERTWTPVADGSYRLGAGQAVLDLRQLDRTPADVDARVAVGSLVVLVPDDVRLQVVAEVGVGAVSSDDGNGTVVDHGNGDDTDLRTAFVVGDVGDPTAGRVDLEVGMGEIEVRRVAA